MPYIVVARKLVDKGKEKAIGWYRTKKEAEADARRLISPWFSYKIVKVNPILDSRIVNKEEEVEKQWLEPFGKQIKFTIPTKEQMVHWEALHKKAGYPFKVLQKEKQRLQNLGLVL